jgi:hypothetical protein
MLTDETDPKIIIYSYRNHPDPGYVWVINPAGDKIIYSVEALQKLAADNMPLSLRSMAQGALIYLKTPQAEEDIHSLTLTTIQGIKVYTDIAGNFIAHVAGSLLRSSSLSYLEKRIKSVGGLK